jgi:hypothetical protein
MKYANPRVKAVGLMFMLGWLLLNTAGPVCAQSINVPDELTPALKVRDIRIGMKGYGLTVFHGTKIEPFNVEVVSIVPNAVPARGVVWVRCPDARMVESGPVQGMSGSPIYLWEEGEPQELGKGGKLIGAFAFGYTDSQQCMVGVQPIDYMRESATRIPDADEAADKRRARHGLTRNVIDMMNNLGRVPGYDGLSPLTRTRHKAMLDLILRLSGRTGEASKNETTGGVITRPRAGIQASSLMLPISLGSPASVEVFGPLLEPLGLMPVAGEAAPLGGAPPHGINANAVSLEPGSVLAVPLAYGDLDLSASGTVTEVLPSGEVLAFGHPMFGLGSAQVPMASGYVHFVMPRRSMSFKNTGSLVPLGTLVRDESAAVVGINDIRYTTAPVDVTINMPSGFNKTYNYEVVNEPMLSAMLVANVVYGSMEAVHGMPVENTFRLQADMRFAGGRKLNIDTLITGGNAIYAVMEVLPPISVLVQNAYESLDIESVSITVDVEEGIRQGIITGGRLERSEVAPGEAVNVLVDIQHYGGEIEQRRITFQLPDDLDEGDYPLTISGANTYAMFKMMSRPHMMITKNIDDMVRYIQETMAYRTDAIYAALQLPEGGIAVGQIEMPQLPSSRAAMLTSPTTTETMPYPRLIDQIYDADVVIRGEVVFTINVRKH